MTLHELNQIASEARSHDGKASKMETIRKRLSEIRNGEFPLMVAYKNLGHWQEEIRSPIEGIINEHGADLIRILELRLDASARQERVLAKQKREQLSAYISDEEAA